MSSIQGLPPQGSDVTILITRVHLHPLCVLVEFWGKFSLERTEEYECLAKDIQSVGKTFEEHEGNPGDKCLVQVDGIWNRARIVSRNGSKFSVFLFDKGVTSCTTTNKLAWGKKEHFLLPPEVEFCVLANVLPLSAEGRWSPVALEFLKTLSGRSVKAHVQDILVSHRTFVLHIPYIAKQMYEMGLAKKLAPDMFHEFVLMSLKPSSLAQVSPQTQLISMDAGVRLHKQELFMVPELPAGTVETVIVTEVANPQRIFCQLKVFSQELKKLSEKITQCCEGRMMSCTVGPEMVGFPCAARGSDGRWYRSVLQQVFPNNGVVEVLNIDYGTKQLVQLDKVRPLASEFLRMPVVTYICSLHGIIDRGIGWTTSQIEFLRNLLLCKTVIAKFEYQSMAEGVHYVTLYGDDNTDINSLFGSKESCLLEYEKTLKDFALHSPAYSHEDQAQHGKRKMLTSGKTEEENEGKGVVEKLPAEELSLNSTHVAFVLHVSNPSEFWIQTQNYVSELDQLMDSIFHLYKESEKKDVVRDPTLGLYCAAKAEDGDFYRAVVTQVDETQIKVFFVDYGNTETIERNNIRFLPDKLKKLPRLALKCSLAGVRPTDGRWTQIASEFFTKTVTDKVLNVHVMAKYDDYYAVQLMDPGSLQEKDLSTLMCTSNFAERAETLSQIKDSVSLQPATLSLTQHSHVRFTDVHENKGLSFQPQNTIDPAIRERVSSFKEHMFPIGSVLDVSVSHIESPNDFWCQLVQNAGHLNLLMRDIQAHYAGSEFQPNVDVACVARYPVNRMWYRAIVINKHKTPHVDVLFVDFGQAATISIYDLRKISPEFLTLPGQAFRCSLLNPVDPTSAINEWNDDTVARFNKFVETAASNFVTLKCTIYAVMYREQKILFNIVDLETPFESICTSMVNLVKSAPPKNVSGPSIHLDTYYYSTHNVKTGTEEQMTVTCVNSVSQFYCQLERNADVMENLTIKVSKLCHQLENVKLPSVFGTLCLAKYTDGYWYRAKIKTTKPAILVHFVDYGDTIKVDKSDLLPVPKEANDVMSVPVQAVVCGLSDVPATVGKEVNSWFEKFATELKFQALIVAREPDGKLLVELYHKNTQINSKIKKMFNIEMSTNESVVNHGQKAVRHDYRPPKYFSKQTTEMDDQTQNVNQSRYANPKPPYQMRDEPKPINMFATKPSRFACENSHKVKAVPLQLYKPPPQRQSCEITPNDMGNGSENASDHVKPRKANLSTDTNQMVMSKTSHTDSQKVKTVEQLPKLADLPSKSITPGLEAEVYVSHSNSPLSFYLQLVRDEDEIFSVAERLNGPTSLPKTNVIIEVHPGDLVQAEFADDSSWYRAVVKEVHSNSIAHVEFIDFGNTVKTPISKMGRLHQSLLLLPMYSTHCMLSDVATCGKEEMLEPEMLSSFKAVCGEGEKKLKCRFIKQSGSVWEVSLEDSGVNVTCKVPTCSADGTEIAVEKQEQVQVKTRQETEKPPFKPCSLHYHQQVFLKGQQLQCYISCINDAHSFWCQSADSEELDKITSGVSEVGNAVNHKHIDPDTLSPGSPCIVLFSDDHLWYRAEVTDRKGDALSVLFVDYGNKSQVSITDVREIPVELVVLPPQAFLCELEGFNCSCGSWASGAVDEFCTRTTDKLLKLTIGRLTRDDKTIKYFVQVECDGQIMNEVMKTWWKSSTTENKPDTGELTMLFEPPLQNTPVVKEAAQPENQPEYSESQEFLPQKEHNEEQFSEELVDPHRADEDKLICSPKTNETPKEEATQPEDQPQYPKSKDIHPLREHSEENFFEELVDPHRADEAKLVCSPQTNETSKDLDSSESQEEKYQTSECNMMAQHEKSDSIEEVNTIHTAILLQTESKDTEDAIVPVPSDQDIFILNCDKDVCESDKIPEEDSASVLDTVGPDDLKSPVDENPKEDTDKSEIPAKEVASSAEEVMTYNVASSYDARVYSVPTDDSNIATVGERSLTSVTAVKMASRDTFHPTESINLHELIDIISEDLEQLDTDLVLSSPVLPEQQLCDLVVDTDETSQSQTCGAASTDMMGDEFEEVTCLMDACTDTHDPDSKVTSAGVNDMITCVTVQDKALGAILELDMEIGDISLQDEDNSTPEEEVLALHNDKLLALPLSDTEPQSDCPDVSNPVDELPSTVEESCLTDVSTDKHPKIETEDSEQMEPTPPKQEDYEEGVVSKETSSPDNSFELQLSNLTHLTLIINDGSADEQQQEE
ncbi:hypothetical protein JOB18_021228 [Solea senegalensis]|uniref:Tudor domain-containing protein n=1 Tax=Solea senegalensis TaxID=28829 RepID=A0AAV6RTB8_SOLSE|nr:tudor domain-containing 6 isoform X1 [Solea senegalensis]KAG7508685.1 hypothetical protein JOB18_021228 [Solea senegalensis]KAG7508686.1 hypothetical protein JOB18_021228 [Solea senegalensis]